MEHTKELLGAYLSGDVRPDERAEVEQLLARDPELKAQAEELRGLLQALKQGERPVSEVLLAQLRENVEKRAGELAVEALLSASLSGDLDAREQAALARHLENHPAARRQLESLRAFSAFLKQGERPVSGALAEKLALRLSAKLPVVCEAQPARAERPSLRVYAAPHNVWPARLAWLGAAAAALVVLAFGAAALFKVGQEIARKDRQNDTAIPPRPEVAPSEVKEQPQIARKSPMPPLPVPDGQKEVAIPIEPKAAQNVVPQNPPRDVVQKEEKTPQPIPAPVPSGPVVVEQKPGPGEEKKVVVPEIREFADRNSRVRPVPPPRPGPIDNTVTQAPQTVPEKGEPPAPTPAGGFAILLVKKDGAVYAMTPTERKSLAPNDSIPSGTEILTDEGRAALFLPGVGTLFVNRKTTLKLVLTGPEPHVTLSAGEVHFQPVGAGTLALFAGNVQIKRAGRLDVLAAGGMATVYAKDAATVTSKSKTVRLDPGESGVIALTGGEIKKEKYGGNPTAWSADLAASVLTGKAEDRGGKAGSRGR